jgi:hypothetical protein
MHPYLLAKKGFMCRPAGLFDRFFDDKNRNLSPYFEIILDISETYVILLYYIHRRTNRVGNEQ